MKNLFYYLVVISVAMGTSHLLGGCSDSSGDSGEWKPEDRGEPGPITPGIYKVEYQIIDDGCEPSLTDIFDKVEGWPPPRLVVEQISFEEDDINLLFVWFVRLRNGVLGNYQLLTNLDFVPSEKYFSYHKGDSLLNFRGLKCELSGKYLTHMSGVFIAPGSFEIIITSDWGDLDSCVYSASPESYKTIPQSTCSESYRIVYELVEECIQPCFVPSLGAYGSVVDGYPIGTYGYPFSCLCY